MTGMYKMKYYTPMEKILYYVIILALYKIFCGKVNHVINTINHIIALLIGTFLIHDIFTIWKINKDKCETIESHMYDNL